VREGAQRTLVRDLGRRGIVVLSALDRHPRQDAPREQAEQHLVAEQARAVPAERHVVEVERERERLGRRHA
jgi:hypothetical protein